MICMMADGLESAIIGIYPVALQDIANIVIRVIMGYHFLQ